MIRFFFILMLLIPVSAFGQITGFFAQSVSGESYSTEYQAILDEIDTNGWTEPSATQKTAGDNLCGCLVTEGHWDDFDWLIIAKGVGDENQAKGINWVNPTGSVINVTESGTITWSASTGFSTNGNGYLNTNWEPEEGVEFVQNDAAFGIWVDDLTLPTTVDYIGGSHDNSSVTTLGLRTFIGQSRTYYGANNTSENIISTQYDGTDALWVTSRDVSTSIRMFVNGSQIQFASKTSGTPNGRDVYLFAKNRLGSPNGYVMSGSKIYLAFAGNSNLDESTVYDCFVTYFSEL
jgi:hypothetical protein